MSDDPGWKDTWKGVPLAFVPQLALIRAKRTSGANGVNGLTALRTVFVSFCGALVLVGLVVQMLGDRIGVEPPTAATVAIVVALGCASLVVVKLWSRSLDGTSDATLSSGYRVRFFVRMAVSEAVALSSFALSIALGPWWLYYVSLPFAFAGFWMNAPTRAHLAQDQDELSLAGCQRSLVDALSGAGATGAYPLAR